MPFLALRPGSFVRLKGQPLDLPDFVLVDFGYRTCRIRQQSWGAQIYLRVPLTNLAVPTGMLGSPGAIESARQH